MRNWIIVVFFIFTYGLLLILFKFLVDKFRETKEELDKLYRGLWVLAKLQGVNLKDFDEAYYEKMIEYLSKEEEIENAEEG